MLSKDNLFRIKFAVALVAVFMVALVGYGFYRAEEKVITEALIADRTVLSDIIKQAFRVSMADSDREETARLVDTLAGLTAVDGIRIYDRKGKIGFSSDRNEVGEITDRSDPACMICHAGEATGENVTVSFLSPEGIRVFRNVNPLENDDECQPCHGENGDLLGVLMVDFSAGGAHGILEDFRRATFFLLLSITLVFGILVFLNQIFDFFRSGP